MVFFQQKIVPRIIFDVAQIALACPGLHCLHHQ
jgi:hypothetical protein